MSKEFIPDSSYPEGAERGPFQPAWPELQPRDPSSCFQQYWKGIEEEVLKKVKKKALFIEKEAYEKGFAQGEKDGFELGRKRLEMMIRQFELLLLNLRGQQEELYKEFEKEMLQLAISISQRVIRHELTVQEGIIQKTLEEAFRNVSGRTKIVVRLNPVDYQYLLTHQEGFPWGRAHTERIGVVEDPSVSRGGCLLETSFGDVDATIESQFAEIVSSIWSRWQSQKKQGDQPIP